jgi:tetrahydromethanopterin S-methyltransferase subunit G
MNFGSPLLPESLRRKNRRTMKILFGVMIGLAVFSVVYILVAN